MRKDKILLSALQTLCVIGGYICARMFFTGLGVIMWLLYYFFSLLTSLAASFGLSFFLSTKFDLKTSAWISTPSTLMYIALYAVEPLVSQGDAFLLVGIFGFVLPFTIIGLLMNSLAIWMGSVIRTMIIKEKSQSINS